MSRQTKLRPEQGGKFHAPVDARPRDVNGAVIDCRTYGDDGFAHKWRPVSEQVARGFTRECCWCGYTAPEVKPSYPGGDPECLECFLANCNDLHHADERRQAFDERDRQ